MMRIHEFKKRTIADVIAFVVLCAVFSAGNVCREKRALVPCGEVWLKKVGYNNYNNVDERWAKWHLIVRTDEYGGRWCPAGNHSYNYLKNNVTWWYELNDPGKDPNHKHLIEIIPTPGGGFKVPYYDKSDSYFGRVQEPELTDFEKHVQPKTPFLDLFHILSLDGNGRPDHF
ncbi:MAG: hypothetical protein LUF25_01835 [Phascolarctobacterium sp.]|nr:hypothetical protein [Phascolarctobacterium sp.]